MALVHRPSRPRPQFQPLEVVGVEPAAEHAVSIAFAVDPDSDYVSYHPGQYLTLRATIADEVVRQSYSIWVPPSRARRESVVRIAAAAVQGGRMSPWLVDHVSVGDAIDVLAPMGEFTLDEVYAARHHVAIAGGSGITPVLAIIAAALEQDPASTFTLVLANRTVDSIVLAAEIAALAASFSGRLVVEHVLSRQRLDGVRSGRIDAPTLNSIVPDPAAVDAWWLCGPEGLIAASEVWLRNRDVPTSRVRRERFTSTGPVD